VDRVQQSACLPAFENRFLKARGDGFQRLALHPSEIWGGLEDWAGVNQTTNPTEKLAITAVLAWLSDHCDIFEEPSRSEP